MRSNQISMARAGRLRRRKGRRLRGERRVLVKGKRR